MKVSNPAHIAPLNHPLSRMTLPPALSRPRPLAPLTPSFRPSPSPFRAFARSRTNPPLPLPATPSPPPHDWARHLPQRRRLQRPSISPPLLPCHHRRHRPLRSFPVSLRPPHPIPSRRPLLRSNLRSSPRRLSPVPSTSAPSPSPPRPSRA